MWVTVVSKLTYTESGRVSLRFADTVVRRWIMVHTLFHCPFWDAERGNLFVALGLDLDLDRDYARMIEAIMDSSVTWTVFARFCEVVMRAKEEAKRDRERDRRARVVHPPVPPSLSWDSDFS